MIIIQRILASLVITFIVMSSGCIVTVPHKEQSMQNDEKTEGFNYISIQEMYGDIPTNMTDQKAWEQWETKYNGKYVRETGTIEEIIIHPKDGKLFLLISIPEKEGHVENNITKIVFSVQDIFGSKDISSGESITFSGKVSNYSSFDENLVYSGHAGLITIEGNLIGI